DQLSADVNTIRRRATKLGLTYPRRGPRITKIKPRVGGPPALKYSIEEQRVQWLQLREANPSLSRQELRKLNSALYTWLLRNDKPWFNSNAPARRKLVGGYHVVDWDARDRSLAARVLEAALTIKEMPGRARGISRRGIA